MAASAKGASAEGIGDGSSNGAGEGIANTSPPPLTMFDRAVRMYGKLLMTTPVRILVIVVFVGYGLFSVLLEPTIVEGLPRTALAPDDSFLHAFFAVFDKVFEAQAGVELDLHFQGFDHSTPDAQARVLAAWGMHLGSEYVVDIPPVPAPAGNYSNSTDGGTAVVNMDGTSSFMNWLTATLEVGESRNLTVPCRDLGVSRELCKLASVPFRGRRPTSTTRFNSTEGGEEEEGPRLLPASKVNESLTAALNATPILYDSVRRSSSDGAVTASRLGVRVVPVADNYDKQLKIFTATEAIDERVNAELFHHFGGGGGGVPPLPEKEFRDGGPRMFTFSQLFVFWQQDAYLWTELLHNLSYAGTGVFIVCLFGLAHPAALLATAGVGIVDLFLFGSMIIGNIRFNAISVVNLVMAVGLAVDYTLHFCHAFLASRGPDSAERVKHVLNTMGSSILKGGGTTLMGTIPMALTKSTIFRTFFALLFSTIIYGLAVGLMFIPVVLSVVPMPIAHHLHCKMGNKGGEKEGEGEGEGEGAVGSRGPPVGDVEANRSPKTDF